jgi:hypothetical protein
VRTVIPILLVSVVLAMVVLWGYERFSHVVVGIRVERVAAAGVLRDRAARGRPVALRRADRGRRGVFFVLIALAFVGLGQVMGRTFAAIPNRVMAYTADVAGSLAGIAAFGVASYLQTTPLVWFAVSVAICLYIRAPVQPDAAHARDHAAARRGAVRVWHRPGHADLLVAVLQDYVLPQGVDDRDEQHAAPGDGADSAMGRRLHAAITA